MTDTPVHPRAAVAVTTPGAHAVERGTQWTNREAAIVANVLGRELTPDDVRAYAAICAHTGLDPFRKEIYCWRDRGQLVIHIGINGWRVLAERSGVYAGQGAPRWAAEDDPCQACTGQGFIRADGLVSKCPVCDGDGVRWRSFWTADTPPAACKVTIFRKDAEPTTHVLTWREFQRTRERTGAKGPTVWDERPAHMLAIACERHGIRKAAPDADAQVARSLREIAPQVSISQAPDDPPESLQAPTAAALSEPAPEEAVEIAQGEAVVEAAE